MSSAAAEKTPAERIEALHVAQAVIMRRDAEARAAAEAEGRDLEHEAAMATASYGIVRASTIEEQTTSWLWEGFFPWGELSIMEGDPGLGKTTVLLSIEAAVTTGTPLPGHAGKYAPEAVLYFTAEDSLAKTIAPRLKGAGANLDLVYVQKPQSAELLLPGAVDSLRGIVRATGARVVVLDPLNAYLDASEINVNSEQDVRRALRPLRDLAEDENVAIIGNRHLNKASDKPALYRGGGSIGLAAVARSVVLVAKHPDDPGLRYLVSQKCNLIEEAKKAPRAFRIGQDARGRPRLEWLTDAPDIDADELLAPKKPGPKADTLEQAKQYLRDHLSAGEKLRGDIIRGALQVRLSESSIDRASRALGVVSKPQGKERLWSLP